MLKKIVVFFQIFCILLMTGAGRKPAGSPAGEMAVEVVGDEYVDEPEAFDAQELETVYEDDEQTGSEQGDEVKAFDENEYEDDGESASSEAVEDIEYITEEEARHLDKDEYEIEYVEVEEEAPVHDNNGVERLPGVPEQEGKYKEGQYKVHRVWIWQETGDCLSGLAEQYYGDASKWELIYQANRDILDNPSKIYPKMELRIPLEE